MLNKNANKINPPTRTTIPLVWALSPGIGIALPIASKKLVNLFVYDSAVHIPT